MTEPIHAKVAKVLNEHQVVLTAGTLQGVRERMTFKVIDPAGEGITDPETGDPLGGLGLSKKRLRVVSVGEKVCLASTLKETVNLGGDAIDFEFPSFSRALMPPRWVTKYDSLRRGSSYPEALAESESIVQVGDPVVQVVEEDAETEGQAAEPLLDKMAVGAS